MFAFIIFLTTALVVVGTIELLHDTDFWLNAQYFDCLHYTNEFTNTHAIKYCIQPKNVADFPRRLYRNDPVQCEKSAIAYSFSSLFERDIHPSIVLSTFRSGIEQADRYGAYFFRRKLNNLSDLTDNDFVCK